MRGLGGTMPRAGRSHGCRRGAGGAWHPDWRLLPGCLLFRRRCRRHHRVDCRLMIPIHCIPVSAAIQACIVSSTYAVATVNEDQRIAPYFKGINTVQLKKALLFALVGRTGGFSIGPAPRFPDNDQLAFMLPAQADPLAGSIHRPHLERPGRGHACKSENAADTRSGKQ